MTQPTFDDGYSDVDDVAERVIETVADGNRETLDLVPAEAIDRELEAALADPDACDDDEWEDLVVEVKDALLVRDLMIA